MIKSGFVNIIKPTGESSSNVVCKIKKILGTKKVGHLGTLDPAAAGVLPIAFGKATKFFDYFLSKDKEYIAVVKFGIETDTLDSFGQIIDKNNKLVSKAEIEAVLCDFIGKIEQIPPKYSAIKIGGKKACDLAREGKEVEIKSRQIEIYDLKLLGQSEENVFRFKVHCTAGTYIRTLFSDIAKKLGTVSTTPVIIRIKSGLFNIGNAITLKELEESKKMISIEELFNGFKTFEISNKETIKKILNGVKLPQEELGFDEKDKFFIKIENQLAGMYHFEQQKLICDVFLAE
ncbi:MAG: tRNA pseudouridine(55) synthase TruB [Clostridia bacterium]|nr:tRNA pseudouridine(55) synthase TruB [Clostridia bacterium]